MYIVNGYNLHCLDLNTSKLTYNRIYHCYHAALSHNETILYCSNSLNHTISTHNLETFENTIIAGIGKNEGVHDDIGEKATFFNPDNISIDHRKGLLYVCCGNLLRQITIPIV